MKVSSHPKTVLFIPGYPEDISTRNYHSVLSAIEAKGYKTMFIPIKWQRTTIKDWVREVESEYLKHDPAETILAGFSFGAMTAMVAAAKRNPAQLWLFSLSAFFSDDITEMKKSWLNEIGHRRADAFRELDFKMLAGQIYSPTLIMLGEAEAKTFPAMEARAVEAHQVFTDIRNISVDGAGHDVSDARYIKSIQKMI